MATDILLKTVLTKEVIKAREEPKETAKEVRDTKRGIKRDTKEAATRRERGPRQLPKEEVTAGSQVTRVQATKEDGGEDPKAASCRYRSENATNAEARDTSQKTVQEALMR